MKAKPLKLVDENYVGCPPEEATFIRLNSPGPIANIMVPVQIKGSRNGTGNWTWNGDTEKPTLKPSIIQDFRPHDSLVNHVWITDGQVKFLNDCSHELAGKTLDLLEV